jgi:aspartyl-tRNA(Asn)/glutamyl-tRNA(Gln) amidotransferase subunit B
MNVTTQDLAKVCQSFQPVIGLETHVELSTHSKMFCACPTEFGGEPNTHVCPVCLGLPGSLPVANAAAIEATIRIGLAMNCQIAASARFARKNYFYPDMPKDFQISQYDEPLCTAGYLDVWVGDGEDRKPFRVGITRVHLEEDTGKLTHAGGDTGRIHGADYSLVDYNRAGVPLVEIVTDPIESAGELAPEVARAYVAAVRDLMRALGVSDVRMEEGSLRCDVNVSLMPLGQEKWGQRTETKNVNSLRSIARAVRSEMSRQAEVLSTGGVIVQETRHFHEDTGETTGGRVKEEAEDYRYFPEPDLAIVRPDPEWVNRLRSELPELPSARISRLAQQWGLDETQMREMVNADAVDLVAATIELGVDAPAARKWWMGELARRANETQIELAELGVVPKDVMVVVTAIGAGDLSDALGRQVFEGIIAGEGRAQDVIASRGLAVVRDIGELQTAIDQAITANADVAQKVRDGKLNAVGVIVGAVMKATKGQADASVVREMVLNTLGVSS